MSSLEVNPIFTVTRDQVRQAFDRQELIGEKGQKVSIGQRRAVAIPAQGGEEPETLELAMLFLSPLAQAGLQGYKFGLVAKHRTPADRKAVEDLAISTVIGNVNEVMFRVFLNQPENKNVTIPFISFELLREDGSRIQPTTQPHSFVVDGRDILTALALAENGQPLTFPTFTGPTPNLTAGMNTMTLVVKVDDEDTNLEFPLR
jgi:hypothetical protein